MSPAVLNHSIFFLVSLHVTVLSPLKAYIGAALSMITPIFFDAFSPFTLQGEVGSPGMLGQKVSGHELLGNCSKCWHRVNESGMS